MKFLSNAKRYHDAEIMAADFLKEYSQHTEITFPINPFQMLNDVGIVFSVREFSKLEGVYIPANGVDDLPVVGINYKRPITRQRFTAAHELCHHFRDADKQIICPISNKNEIEKFADRFASALLMPYRELKRLVSECADADGNVSLDSVLQISDYFGVSFESCLFRIAYVIHAISGNTEPTELKRACRRFKPDAKRIALGMNNILRGIDGDENVKAWTAGGTKIGRLSKGKIHCSCWMCRVKSYDYLSHMDTRRIQGMADEEREWQQDKGTDQEDDPPLKGIYTR